MERYDINPMFNVENGIVFKEPENQFSDDIIQGYDDYAIQGLKNDLVHYDGMMKGREVELKEFRSSLYDRIYALGGGFPKLETYTHVNSIVVFDGIDYVYRKHMDSFRKIYDYQSELLYSKAFIENVKIYNMLELDPSSNTLISFCHFLEHQSKAFHLELLEKLPRGIDVVIYGPNIEAARNERWTHFNWKYHHTFIPKQRMLEILKGYGYKIKTEFSYSDDMFIWFST